MELSKNTNIKQIESILEDYARYWNASDMDAWGKLFTDDVDYINRNGGWWKNNEDNINGHKQIHMMLTAMGQSRTFHLEAKKIDFLKSDVAIVQAYSEWPDFKPTNHGKPTNNLRGIMSCVFVKMDGNWLIKTLHNTLRRDEAK